MRQRIWGQRAIKAEQSLYGARIQAAGDIIKLIALQKSNDKLYKIPSDFSYRKDDSLGLVVSTQITDGESFYNINSLASNDKNQLQYFSALLQRLQPSISADDAIKLTQNIVTWVSSNNQQNINPAYKKLKYPPPHHLMTDISELRVVPGITRTLYTKLSNILIALPQKDSTYNCNLNNTWNIDVLQTCGLSTEQIEALKSCRSDNKILTNAQECPGIKPDSSAAFNFSSQYFLIKNCAKLDGVKTQHCLQTLVRSDIDPKLNNAIEIRTIWQRTTASMRPQPQQPEQS